MIFTFKELLDEWGKFRGKLGDYGVVRAKSIDGFEEEDGSGHH